MRIKEEIKLEAEILREKGVEGQLHVVPSAISLRCFVPCVAGTCICRGTIENRFCLVNDSGKAKALEHANSDLQVLNGFLNDE